MRYLLVMVPMLVAAFASVAQSRVAEAIMEPDLAWSEGSIMLKDGKEIRGVLRYSNNMGTLSFQNGDEGKTLTARQVVAFEFYDESLVKQRMFYSFEDKEEGTDILKYFFFEVIR